MPVLSESIRRLLQDPGTLVEHVQNALLREDAYAALSSENVLNSASASSVLFLLGPNCSENTRAAAEPCLILNLRSDRVRQPGDLCCPGGSISPHPDVYLAKLLYLPFFSLARWSNWVSLRRRCSRDAFQLAVLMATALRESFEEMRLNPLGVKFLGLLPSERLVMFRRVIYPLVGWVKTQRRFYPNWEVEKVIHVPLRNLLNPENYMRFRLKIDIPQTGVEAPAFKEFPCYVHAENGKHHRLWGATFRILLSFVQRVFELRVEEINPTLRVERDMPEHYYTGRRRSPQPTGRRPSRASFS